MWTHVRANEVPECGQPVNVFLLDASEPVWIPCEKVKQPVFVLFFDDLRLLFTKSSGFSFKVA